MKPVPTLLALAVLLSAGCTGLPEGSADFGDTVTVRYSVTDVNGTVVRAERQATFQLGSGDSGMGLAFERGLRGTMPGENVSFVVEDDPTLRFSRTVEVDRELSSFAQTESAPRADYEASQGPAAVGQSFPYSFYLVRVTGVDANYVNLTVEVDPDQRNEVPGIGAVVISNGDGQTVTRRLEPMVGATFSIAPPTRTNPQTPLGLEPGSYRTLGGTEDKIQYAYSAGEAPDLIGRDLQFKATLVRLVPGSAGQEPVDGNYAARHSPYVNGDPDSVLGASPAGAEDDHGH